MSVTLKKNVSCRLTKCIVHYTYESHATHPLSLQSLQIYHIDRFCRILNDKGHVVWDLYGCNLLAYWLKLHMCELMLIDSRRMF